jgi:peptidoglycan/xylan/chitin deacetylase (PgdA/CDA1 family)
MNYISHLVRSKGAPNLLHRLLQIHHRFGYTSKRISKNLEEMLQLSQTHRCVPTFFVTASLVENHGRTMEPLLSRNVQIGLHGLHHVDHALLSGEAQLAEMKTGLEKLKSLNLDVAGFRGPFLRFNEETCQAIATSGLSWSSHSTLLFHDERFLAALDRSEHAKNLVRKFYTHQNLAETPSLPVFNHHCLEIPVSLPDDEILVDRLRILDHDEITGIWTRLLDFTHQQGELMNLLVHAERLDQIALPLDRLLADAAKRKDVWLASLDEIARWWHRRSNFSFTLHPSENHCHDVGTTATDRASLLLEHPDGRTEYVEEANGERFRISTPFRPTIHVAPGAPPSLVDWLRNDGYLLETNGNPDQCALVLDASASGNARDLLASLRRARGPLLRFARWPDRYRSALAVSLDLDAFTISDFFRRARHFRNAKERQ